MKKDTQILVLLGVVTLGAYFLFRKKSSESTSGASNFTNFINQQSNVQVTSQITSGYSNFITQFASTNADQYGKRWYLYVFSDTPQYFVGNTPTYTPTLAPTNILSKVSSCNQFVNLANQIGLQYPNYQPFSRFLNALIQMPTNPCAREWWFKNMFGLEFINPKVSATYTNEQAIGTAIANLKTYVANTYPRYRIAIVRQ